MDVKVATWHCDLDKDVLYLQLISDQRQDNTIRTVIGIC